MLIWRALLYASQTLMICLSVNSFAAAQDLDLGEVYLNMSQSQKHYVHKLFGVENIGQVNRSHLWKDRLKIFHDGDSRVDQFLERFDVTTGYFNPSVVTIVDNYPNFVVLSVTSVNTAFQDGEVPFDVPENWHSVVDDPDLYCWYGTVNDENGTYFSLILYSKNYSDIESEYCVANTIPRVLGFQDFLPNRDFGVFYSLRDHGVHFSKRAENLFSIVLGAINSR